MNKDEASYYNCIEPIAGHCSGGSGGGETGGDGEEGDGEGGDGENSTSFLMF